MLSALFFPVILNNHNQVWEQVTHLGNRVKLPVKKLLINSSANSNLAGFYYIHKGLVRLSHISYDGQECILLYLTKGMLFNEIPMLSPAANYQFTCMELVEATYWDKKILSEAFVQEYPHLMLNLVHSLSYKSSRFYDKLCSGHVANSFTNTCRTLYSMLLYNKVGNYVVPRLSQQEFAAMLGIHRSSLHKALRTLKEEHIIGTYSRTKLSIYDEAALLAYTQYTSIPSYSALIQHNKLTNIPHS